MAGVPGLSRRGNVWQFRVRVPDKLRKTIGKGEIVKSLGTVSHAEAARLARIERVTLHCDIVGTGNESWCFKHRA